MWDKEIEKRERDREGEIEGEREREREKEEEMERGRGRGSGRKRTFWVRKSDNVEKNCVDFTYFYFHILNFKFHLLTEY